MNFKNSDLQGLDIEDHDDRKMIQQMPIAGNAIIVQADIPKVEQEEREEEDRMQNFFSNDTQYNQGHNFVQKDFYRVHFNDIDIRKALEHKKSSGFGHCPKKSILERNNAKYKQISDLIIQEFERAEIPESRLYQIDKVVRSRGQEGRFGIDHSELLNYELELANKLRDDHINWMVKWRELNKKSKDDGNGTVASPFFGFSFEEASTMIDEDTGLTIDLSETKKISEILFKRLNPDDHERYSDASFRTKQSSSAGSSQTNQSEKSYADWTKKKIMEDRLKRKLIRDAKNEIKEELLEIAKAEKSKYENRLKAMEKWLELKKVQESHNKTHLKQIEQRADDAGNVRNAKSFNEWQRQQKRR